MADHTAVEQAQRRPKQTGAFQHPSLLRNRFIRNYLVGYSQQEWDQRVKLLVLLGIQTANATWGEPASHTVEQLRELISSQASASIAAKAISSVDELVRSVAESATSLKRVLTEEDAEPLAKVAIATAHEMVSRSAGISAHARPGKDASLPSNDRYGTTASTLDQHQPEPGKPRKPVLKSRSPAKSTPNIPSKQLKANHVIAPLPPSSIDEDDLVTTRWLGVDGSGYGQKASGKAAPRYAWLSAAVKDRRDEAETNASKQQGTLGKKTIKPPKQHPQSTADSLHQRQQLDLHEAALAGKQRREAADQAAAAKQRSQTSSAAITDTRASSGDGLNASSRACIAGRGPRYLQGVRSRIAQMARADREASQLRQAGAVRQVRTGRAASGSRSGRAARRPVPGSAAKGATGGGLAWKVSPARPSRGGGGGGAPENWSGGRRIERFFEQGEALPSYVVAAAAAKRATNRHQDQKAQSRAAAAAAVGTPTRGDSESKSGGGGESEGLGLLGYLNAESPAQLSSWDQAATPIPKAARRTIGAGAEGVIGAGIGIGGDDAADAADVVALASRFLAGDVYRATQTTNHHHRPPHRRRRRQGSSSVDAAGWESTAVPRRSRPRTKHSAGPAGTHMHNDDEEEEKEDAAWVRQSAERAHRHSHMIAWARDPSSLTRDLGISSSGGGSVSSGSGGAGSAMGIHAEAMRSTAAGGGVESAVTASGQYGGGVDDDLTEAEMLVLEGAAGSALNSARDAGRATQRADDRSRVAMREDCGGTGWVGRFDEPDSTLDDHDSTLDDHDSTFDTSGAGQTSHAVQDTSLSSGGSGTPLVRRDGFRHTDRSGRAPSVTSSSLVDTESATS